MDWAANNDCVILTHDRKTMAEPAKARFLAGFVMPGAIVVSRTITLAKAIEDIAITVLCSEPDDWPSRVRDIPIQ